MSRRGIVTTMLPIIVVLSLLSHTGKQFVDYIQRRCHHYCVRCGKSDNMHKPKNKNTQHISVAGTLYIDVGSV